MTNKEFSERLKAGLKIAERRMLEEKALRGEDIIVSSDGRAHSCKTASLISMFMGTMVPDPIAPIGTSSDIIFNRRISPSNSFSDPFQIKEWRYSPEQHHRGLCEDNSS